MKDKKIGKALGVHITVLILTISLIVLTPIFGIFLGLLVVALGIALFVLLIVGTVFAFKLKQTSVGVLYILGIFLPLLALIGASIGIAKTKKQRQTLEETINTDAF
ncbi:hypothetical protein [Metamycoplasma gateae]|uniref:Uncharacterized protein n=1 Tax=Metamycoplasma gateae TaxID=35769 RepID=A0ABZ2AGQ2_9BACT|nr:hypothetical protein V2E26_02380 [Metamycoplasma gateae]